MAQGGAHPRQSRACSPVNVSKPIYGACHLNTSYERFTQDQLSKCNRAPRTSSSICKMPFSAPLQHHVFEVYFPEPTSAMKPREPAQPPRGCPFHKAGASDRFPHRQTGQRERNVEPGCTATRTHPMEKSSQRKATYSRKAEHSNQCNFSSTSIHVQPNHFYMLRCHYFFCIKRAWIFQLTKSMCLVLF